MLHIASYDQPAHPNTTRIAGRRWFATRDGILRSISLALSFSIATQSGSFAQSSVNDEPSFRPRTDPYAVEDLKRLREELNRATDANGSINPLGNFLERSNRAKETARRESEKQDEFASDSNSQSNRDVESASKSKPRRETMTLPGPRLTIIQQASPQVRNVDGFRPARTVADLDATIRPSLEYPVAFASANLPIVGQPSNYIANYQSGPEIPSGANSGAVLPPGFPSQPGLNPNVQPVMPPVSSAIQTNPNNMGGGMPNPTPPFFSTPIPNTPSTINNPVSAPPMYPQPAFNPTMPMNSDPRFSGGSASPSDSVRTPISPYTNSAPFVSNAPRQFDARNMVACSAYRQSIDPCAQPCRSNPNGYAPAPYATGGSPFSYVPSTFMPYGKTSGYRPLIGFGQDSYDPFLGRGIIGQPVAYVDGQPVRNFIRYLFP